MGLVKKIHRSFFPFFFVKSQKNSVARSSRPAMKKPWEDLMDVQEEDVSLVNEPDAEMVHQWESIANYNKNIQTLGC